MNRKQLVVMIGVVALGAAGIGAGVAVAVSHGVSSQGTTSTAPVSPIYSYYRSMMANFDNGSMMGGSGNSIMGQYSYQWMMGGAGAPGWMHGGKLAKSMMGTNTDPGEVMGALFANAPGPRISPSEATKFGNQTPSGATVDAKSHRITFSGSTVHLVVLASPPGGPDETFRASGMVNPTIVVRKGAHVRIEVINADPDTAHGLVVTNAASASSWMPMMTAAPAFSGSALWFLGEPTSTGLHAGTISFTASVPGTYQYLCAVPGHARKGMVGTFLVTG